MYKAHDRDVAEKCLGCMANHGWYLYETLIPLSLVDPRVSDDIKRDLTRDINSSVVENILLGKYMYFDQNIFRCDV